jgi:pimeloyl-ACP methyl ester carboxylesterase
MTQHIENVVLVHGAFADGSGWEAVANILKDRGYTVSVVQHPETSYAEDQKYTKAAIDAIDGPVVLVGHSYGGSVITEAGNHPKVRALVYIAAFALDEGESCASIEQALPQASKAFKPDGNGNWWIDEAHFAADFAADIPREKAEFMAISQVPISTDSFTHKVTNPAWKHKPTWYMVATEDRSINPDQERMMAKRAKAKTVEVKASHVAYMSYPKETAKLIEEAATSVAAHQSAAGGLRASLPQCYPAAESGSFVSGPLDLPPILRQPVKTQLIFFCIEWRIESWDCHAGSSPKSSNWPQCGGWSRGYPSAKQHAHWRSTPTCCNAGAGSFAMGQATSFPGMGSSAGRMAGSRSWSARSANRRWRSIF